MLGTLQFAVEQAQPVREPVQADGAMPLSIPQTVFLQATQILRCAEKAQGIKAHNDQMAMGAQHALHFPQAAMGVFIELQSVERDYGVYTVALQW